MISGGDFHSFLSMLVHSGRGHILQPSLLFLLCPITLLLLLGSAATEQLVTPQHLNPEPPALVPCQRCSLLIVFLFCLLPLHASSGVCLSVLGFVCLNCTDAGSAVTLQPRIFPQQPIIQSNEPCTFRITTQQSQTHNSDKCRVIGLTFIRRCFLDANTSLIRTSLLPYLPAF